MKKQIQLLSLKTLRQRTGMTQKDLAGKLQVSFQTVSKWENGIALPDITYLPGLAEIFDVSIDVLLGIKPLESDKCWRQFDGSEYWHQNMERTKQWKSLFWNDDYFAFLVRNVWRIHTPVNILDFGCGYGFLGMKLLPLLPDGSTYTGIDMDGEAIDSAERLFRNIKGTAEFIRENVYQYEPKKTYDIVISLYLLSYLKEPEIVLEKMKSSLAAKGKLIVMDGSLEMEQAGYYSDIETKEGLRRPDYTPVWENEKKHGERDYRMGLKLPGLLKSIGLTSVQARISDRVILYDAEEKPENKAFRYVHKHKDSTKEGLSYYQARGVRYPEAVRYVEYAEKTGRYLDSEDAFAVSTSGLYFVWGELPEDRMKGDNDDV